MRVGESVGADGAVLKTEGNGIAVNVGVWVMVATLEGVAGMARTWLESVDVIGIDAGSIWILVGGDMLDGSSRVTHEVKKTVQNTKPR